MPIKRVIPVKKLTKSQPSPVSPETTSGQEEVIIENVLRPKKLTEYVGQSQIKVNLSIYIEAAKKRSEPLEHILFYGPPGLGKTTIANIIANEMGVNIKTTAGPAIEKAGDLASILSNIREGDILFIDEIHRLKTTMEEILYSAMEDFALDIVLGKGPGARSIRLKLPKFTLVGATTKIGALSSPLRSRFGDIIKLQFYTPEEMSHILKRSASILEMDIEEEALKLIGLSSRATPRIGNRLLKRIRDFSVVKHSGTINKSMVSEGLNALGVDRFGLDATDRDILETIIHKFGGGPVGLSTLAASLSEEKETIEEVYEPYLLQIGFISRSPRGRLVTPQGYEYLGIQTPSHALKLGI